MLFWAILAAFLIPLIYVILNTKKEKQDRERQLKVIQKKLAQKENGSNIDEESSS